jgi:hypothetical protein
MSLSEENYDKICAALKRADQDQLLGIHKYAAELYRLESRRANRVKITELEKGMRVMFPNNTKPKYLSRQLATVEDKKDTRVLVKLDRGPQGKFRTGRVWVPAGMLTILQNQPQLEG